MPLLSIVRCAATKAVCITLLAQGHVKSDNILAH